MEHWLKIWGELLKNPEQNKFLNVVVGFFLMLPFFLIGLEGLSQSPFLGSVFLGIAILVPLIRFCFWHSIGKYFSIIKLYILGASLFCLGVLSFELDSFPINILGELFNPFRSGIYFIPLVLFIIVFILSWFWKNSKIYFLKNILQFFVAGAFILVVFMMGISFVFIDEIISLGIEEILMTLGLFVVGGLVVLFTWFTLLDTQESVDLWKSFKGWFLVSFGAVLVLFPFLGTSLLDSLVLNPIQEYRETKVRELIDQEDYKKLGEKKWLKEKLLKEPYVFDNSANIYRKIYDASFEEDKAQYLKKGQQDWSSNGTNKTFVGDNALVEMNFLEMKTDIKTELGIAETTLLYEFYNPEFYSQEVIMDFLLPSSQSVVSELRLGKFLQFEGISAPRGAAQRVYNDSVRRNTDPALLHQKGPQTYELRVFPILERDTQKVQFTYITPLEEGTMDFLPRTSGINIKPEEKVEVSIKRYKNGDFESETKAKDTVAHIFSKKNKTVSEASLFRDLEVERSLASCVFEFENSKSVSENREVAIFFDISKSADQKTQKKIYKAVEEKFETYEGRPVSQSLYAYNYEATRVTSSQDLEFYGPSDTRSIVNFINKNKSELEQKSILIITDTSSHEAAVEEMKNLDYQVFANQRLAMLTVGDGVKRLPDSLTKGMLLSGGEIFDYTGEETIDQARTFLLGERSKRKSCESSFGPTLSNDLAKKIKASREGISKLQNIKGQDTWMQFGDFQAKIGSELGIVNQFNSLIALENESQKKDLERYSKESDRYEVEALEEEGSINSMRPIFFDSDTSNIGGASLSMYDDGIYSQDMYYREKEERSLLTNLIIILLALFIHCSWLWFLLTHSRFWAKNSVGADDSSSL